MGYIKKLKNNELVGGTDKHTIYPVTSTKAVFEEVTESDKSSFKSQETINGEHDDRIKGLEEEMPDTVKSITINGGTEHTVDESGNVDLTIYTVNPDDPDVPAMADLVEKNRDDIADIKEEIGTDTTENTLSGRIKSLETAVGTGGSVDQRISNGITTALDNLDAEYSDDGESYIDFHLKQANGKIDDFEIEDSKLQNAITSLTNAIGGGNITLVESLPATGDAGKIYRIVNNDDTYTDYMYVAGESTPWKPLAVHDLSTIQPQIAYYTCTASGSGALETKVFVSNGSLTYSTANGGHIKIKMGEANTHAAPVYLKFNTEASTSKQVYYNGKPVSASNTWDDLEVISVYYDGTYYQASNAQGGGGKAKKIKYDNTQNLLIAENVQDAIDEMSEAFQYTVETDITSLAERQSSSSQDSVFYSNSGNLTAAGYASAYKITLPEGTTKIRIENAYNSVYWARLVYFNDDTKVRTFKQADLPNNPIILDIPDGVNAIGLNRSTNETMFSVIKIDKYKGIDGSQMKDGSIALSKMASDVTAELMTDDNEKNKILTMLKDSKFSTKETVLHLPISSYSTEFSVTSAVWGLEKYENPVEIVGARVNAITRNTVTIFIYNRTTLQTVLQKSAVAEIGENIVYLDTPYVLQENELVGISGKVAGCFDNTYSQVGCYSLNRSTGELTPQPRNSYAWTVIYKSDDSNARGNVLYSKDFSSEENNGDFIESASNTIVATDGGVTLSGNDYIYLNRMYSCNRTIRMVCTLYEDSVIKLGYYNPKTRSVSYVSVINCQSGKISIGSSQTDFSVVDGRKYAIDLMKDDYVGKIVVTDSISAISVSITHTNMVQNDYPTICLDSGTSPLIESYTVFTGVAEPYIMFFGDSITDGAQTPRYNGRFLSRFSDMIGRKLGKPYMTSGRAGSTISYITDEICGRMYSEAKILRPKYAFVTIGTNGGNNEHNLTLLVKKLTDYGIKVILNNVPNRTHNGAEESIAGTNNLLESIRNTYGLSGVRNEYSCSVNNDGVTTDTSLYGPAESGYVIHPNGEGHYRIYLRTFIDCPEIYVDAGVYPKADEVPSGTTSERPANAELGQIYMDTTLGYHVWATGEGGWLDKNGNTV